GALRRRLARAGPGRRRLRRARRLAHGAQARRHAPLRRAVPVPRRALAVVRYRPGREALPLLRLRGGRRRLQVRDGDGGDGLHHRARVARGAVGDRARAHGGGPARGRAPRAAGPAAGAARADGDLLRAGAVGGSGGRPGARVPARSRTARGVAARVPGRLRAERLGQDPGRLPAGGLLRGGAAGGRSRAEGARGPGRLRRVPRAHHLPAVRPARPRTRLRRPRDARQPGPEVRQLARERGLLEGQAGLCVRPGPRVRVADRRGHPRRGLHGRHRAAPGGDRQRGRVDGDGADRGAGERAQGPRADGRALPGRRRRRPAGDGPGGGAHHRGGVRPTRGAPAAGRRPGRHRRARGRGGGDARADRRRDALRALPGRARAVAGGRADGGGARRDALRGGRDRRPDARERPARGARAADGRPPRAQRVPHRDGARVGRRGGRVQRRAAAGRRLDDRPHGRHRALLPRLLHRHAGRGRPPPLRARPRAALHLGARPPRRGARPRPRRRPRERPAGGRRGARGADGRARPARRRDRALLRQPRPRGAPAPARPARARDPGSARQRRGDAHRAGLGAPAREERDPAPGAL
ncbi:MAG: DNA primase, partial [uncultured Solirubrobacteraceae bacterium]